METKIFWNSQDSSFMTRNCHCSLWPEARKIIDDYVICKSLTDILELLVSVVHKDFLPWFSNLIWLAFSLSHSYAHTHKLTHKRTQTRTESTHTHTNTHTNTQTHTNTHKHKHMQSHTHKHKQTYKHTHTNTHTLHWDHYDFFVTGTKPQTVEGTLSYWDTKFSNSKLGVMTTNTFLLTIFWPQKLKKMGKNAPLGLSRPLRSPKILVFLNSQKNQRPFRERVLGINYWAIG